MPSNSPLEYSAGVATIRQGIKQKAMLSFARCLAKLAKLAKLSLAKLSLAKLCSCYHAVVTQDSGRRTETANK